MADDHAEVRERVEQLIRDLIDDGHTPSEIGQMLIAGSVGLLTASLGPEKSVAALREAAEIVVRLAGKASAH